MTEERRNYESITEENTYKNEDENYSTTQVTTTYARANKKIYIITPEMMDEMDDYYEQNFGRIMPPVICKLVIRCLKDGMEPGLIYEAIDQTMSAPRPTLYYLRAILNRWLESGILTKVQQEADQEQHRAEMRYRSTRRWRTEEVDDIEDFYREHQHNMARWKAAHPD